MIARQQLLKSLRSSKRELALHNCSTGSRPMLLFSAKRYLTSTTPSDISPKSHLYQNIRYAYGEAGIQWLKSLPNNVRTLVGKWQLKDLSVVKPHEYSYNYVLLGKRQDGEPIVLKLGYDKKAIVAESNALKIYNGRGSVKLLDIDLEHNAILRECVLPGESLKSKYRLNDSFVLPIIGSLITTLHDANVPKRSLDLFPKIDDEYTLLYYNEIGKHIPAYHLCRARALSRELIATQRRTLLLHGDLHSENILHGDANKWVAIDPKGMIGEPAYECIPLIKDSISEVSYPVIQNRIKYFSNFFGISEQRLSDWCYVNTVLSVCQAIKDGTPGDHWGNSHPHIVHFCDESPNKRLKI